MENPQSQSQSKYIRYVFFGIIVLGVIVAVIYTLGSDQLSWTEWVLQGQAGTCGAGVNVYKRQCTLGSVVQGSIDACVNSLGGSDSKSETYSFSNKCFVYGRYIILERTAPSGASKTDDYLNIQEVKVYDQEGNNLIGSGAMATAGSTYGGHSPNHLIDGNLNTMAHTAGKMDYSLLWFKIDLGEMKPISKIEVYNRTDYWKIRTVGVRVRVTDEAQKDVYVGPTINAEMANAIDKPMVFHVA